MNSFVDGAGRLRRSGGHFRTLLGRGSGAMCFCTGGPDLRPMIEMLNVEGIVLEPAGALAVDVLPALGRRDPGPPAGGLRDIAGISIRSAARSQGARPALQRNQEYFILRCRRVPARSRSSSTIWSRRTISPGFELFQEIPGAELRLGSDRDRDRDRGQLRGLVFGKLEGPASPTRNTTTGSGPVSHLREGAMDLAGKVCIVTCARRAGSAMLSAARFACGGGARPCCRTWPAQRNPPRLWEHRGSPAMSGTTGRSLPLFAETEARLGPVDLFCSNAGVGFGDADHAASRVRPGLAEKLGRECHGPPHFCCAQRGSFLRGLSAGDRGYLVNVPRGRLLERSGTRLFGDKHALGLPISLAIAHGMTGSAFFRLCPQYVATPMIGYENPGQATHPGRTSAIGRVRRPWCQASATSGS